MAQHRINRLPLLIVYDFDGVMTDNRVLVDEYGKESVYVHRGDGFAIARLQEMGIRQIILSTEKNPVVARRSEKLKLDVIYGVDDKRTVLINFCDKEGYLLDDVLFIGNDLNDYDCMMVSGIRGCPADAEHEIKAIADWISMANGGYGVIRDLFRCIVAFEEANKKEA